MKPEESSDNYFVNLPYSMIESYIERVVKENGQLIVATHNTDWDKEGNFIGDYSEVHKKTEKFVQKYNPQNLSMDEYREAYEKGELPWQKE